VGVLEQGKRVKPNYKVRKRIEAPKEQWVRVENAHEPIVSRDMFETVQNLLKQDTRSSAKNESVRPLSGIIVCADCGATMVHKTNTKNGKRYGYYVCSKHRADTSLCSTHIINSEACEIAVLAALKAHTAAVIDVENIACCAENLAYRQSSLRKLAARLDAKQEEIKQANGFRLSLYESYKEGVITREDFVSFKANYDKKIHEAEAAILSLKEESERAAGSGAENCGWSDYFKMYLNAETLGRRMVVELVEKVAVYENGRIEVVPRYFDEFERLSGVVREVA
jgi:hypothetical protein